ncbi:ABC transporter permease [Paraburkholderia sp.]|uniref:ABC transporter permease n=1 Tax=Paraburkholderia sp. TaxID=1926495 RepID=UPI0039E4C70D
MAFELVRLPNSGMVLPARSKKNWDWKLLVGAAIVGVMIVCAVFAPWLAPYPFAQQSLAHRLIPPVFMTGGSWAHPLGTDQLGRDYLSRLIFGARYSLMVGFGAILISSIVGIGLGIAGGFFGSYVDTVVMFLLSVRLSMPVMLAAIAIAGLLGSSLGLLVIVLASFLWDRFLSVARSMTSRIRDAEFVLAAKASGCSNLRILFGEVLPNLAPSMVVIATLEMAHAILLEATFSFLGLGIRPPASSWGLMIAEAKDFVFFDPWLVNIPGIAIFVLISAITLMGAGLQQSLSTRE